MRPLSRSGRRVSEAGGITIIIAFVLIIVMSLAAFSLSRNSIRELATAGSVIQGDKASAASDAGLDWFVVWAIPENRSVALASPSVTANYDLARAVGDMQSTDWYAMLSSDGLLASTDSARAWDRAARVTSKESETATSDMAFDNTSTTAVFQAKNDGGSPVVQRFDLLVRFLGFQTVPNTGGGGNAAGGTNPNAKASQDTTWQIVSTGNAAVPIGGGNYLRYQQRREMVGTQPLSQTATSSK